MLPSLCGGDNIDGYEERETCATCNETESMSHILTQCKEKHTQLIWELAKTLWPHQNIPWPEVNMGTILGCGCINLRPGRLRRNNQRQNKKITHRGPTRLSQIILSKSAYLIWYYILRIPNFIFHCLLILSHHVTSSHPLSITWPYHLTAYLSYDSLWLCMWLILTPT